MASAQSFGEAELARRFFDDAAGRDLPGAMQRVVEIALSPVARSTLVELIAQSEAPKPRRAVVDCFEDVADDADGLVDYMSAITEPLDRSALPVATAALLSGAGLLVSTGLKLQSTALFACGSLGLVVAGLARNRLKAYERRGKAVSKKTRRLAIEIRSL